MDHKNDLFNMLKEEEELIMQKINENKERLRLMDEQRLQFTMNGSSISPIQFQSTAEITNNSFKEEQPI
jgi:hypothetical protein